MMKKGFTLLEVLVSIVIISSSIIVIFQIFSHGFSNIEKLSTYQDLYVAMTNLTEEIDLISDFEQNKEKTGKIGNFEYEWQAFPSSPKKRMTSFAGDFGPLSIALYEIVVKIYFETRDGRKNYKEFIFYKVGWTNV